MFRYDSPTKRFLMYVILLITAFMFLIPFIWTVENAFKPDLLLHEPSQLIPFLQYEPSLSHWNKAWYHSQVSGAMVNSLVVSVGTTFIVLILGTTAGYALSRYEYPLVSNKDLTIFFLSQRVLPPVVVLIPFFTIMMTLGLVDTRTGLILVNVTFTLPFGVLIMKSIFDELPDEIMESGLVDGANEFQVFWSMALPLGKNGLIASALIVFAFAWNEALFALTLTGSEAQTVPVIILSSRSTQGVNFGYAAINTLLAIGPPIILTIFLQGKLAQGLTFGAVKQ